jgi:hypothetical protein
LIGAVEGDRTTSVSDDDHGLVLSIREVDEIRLPKD